MTRRRRCRGGVPSRRRAASRRAPCAQSAIACLGCVLAAAVRARDRAERDAAAPPGRPERGDRQVGRHAPWEGQAHGHARAQVDHRGHVGDWELTKHTAEAEAMPDGWPRGAACREIGPVVAVERRAGRRRADVVAAVALGIGVGRAGGTDDKAKVTVRMGCGPTTPTTSSRFSCCAAPMGSRHFPGRIAGRRGGRWHGTTRRPLGHENYRRLAFSLVPGNGFIRATVMAKLLQGKPFRIGGF